MEIKKHFGVYAVCFENGKLLRIEKTRGPYQHRYDLPGGSQNLVKDWRKRWLEKLWKRQDLLLEAIPILESTMFSSGKS